MRQAILKAGHLKGRPQKEAQEDQGEVKQPGGPGRGKTARIFTKTFERERGIYIYVYRERDREK